MNTTIEEQTTDRPGVTEPPITNALAWRALPIYSKDGSGEAGQCFDEAIKTIEEWEAVHRLHRAFLDKHAVTLAGLIWRVAYLEAVIEIRHSYYRGEKVIPETIAKLWPGTAWKRVREKYSSKSDYNWEAVLDGITLRIESAETEEPAPRLIDGEEVLRVA